MFTLPDFLFYAKNILKETVSLCKILKYFTLTWKQNSCMDFNSRSKHSLELDNKVPFEMVLENIQRQAKRSWFKKKKKNVTN